VSRLANHNMPGIEKDYLAALNRCFEGWGDASTFRWCFSRKVGHLDADLITLHRDGRLVAGSAVTYRPVALPNREMIQAGIMTGSWTLPEERGKGSFTQLIGESLRVAAGRGAALLLAFGIVANPSCRRLAAAGATMIPTHYLFSPPALPPAEIPGPRRPACVALPPEEVIDRCLTSYQHAAGVRFVYSAQEWAGQFLQRAQPTTVVSVNAALAVVEGRGDWDHLLFLSPSSADAQSESLSLLAQCAAASGRRLRAFTTSASTAGASAGRGFEVRPGFLYVFITPGASGDLRPSALKHWYLQSGDRM
jgi:hypothetical protein